MLGVGEVEPAPGPGDGDVHEAPLFFQAAAFVEAVLVGEQAFFQAGDEHRVELQALGGVDAHQLHRVLALGGLVLAGLQGGVAEEGFQALVVAVGGEGGGGVGQFVQVLHPVLAVLFVLVELQQAGTGDDVLHLFHQGQAGRVIPANAWIQATAFPPVARRRRTSSPPERRPPPTGWCRPPGPRRPAFQGTGADAPGREVHHAQEGVVVLRVGGQAQVGQGVLDLGALEEAQAAIDPVRECRRRTGRVPGCATGRWSGTARPCPQGLALALQALDFLHHEAGFLAVVVGLEVADQLPLARVGPQVLAQAPCCGRSPRWRHPGWWRWSGSCGSA
jgi:hypothetical protein